jgi:hypothetical protein
MSRRRPEDVAQRRLARAGWPVSVHRLDEEPSDDLSATTTPAERIAMMAELAEAAFRVTGRPLPSYERHAIPGRLFQPGEPRPDDDA